MLKIWLPLNKDLRNQGLRQTFPDGGGELVNDSRFGKVWHTSPTNSIDTYLPAAEWDTNTGSIGFGCWAKFNLAEIQAVSAYSYTSSYSRMECSIVGPSYYGGYGINILTNNIYTDGKVTSATINAYLRCSSTIISAAIANVVFDEWHHYYTQFDFDKKAVYTYFDGQFAHSGANINLPQTAFTRNFSVNLGACYGGNANGRCLPFYVHDVRLYDGLLTEENIKELASGKIFEVNGRFHFDKNTNLLDYSNIRGHGSTFELLTDTFEGGAVYRNTVTSPNTGNNAGFAMLQPITPDGLSSATKISISFYKKLVSVYGKNLGGYVRVVKSDATEATYSWSYNNPSWANDSSSIGKWEYITSTVTIPTGCTQIKYVYVYTDRATGGVCDYSKIQLELNDRPTQYCIGNRPETAFSFDGCHTMIGSSGVTQSGNTLYFNGSAGMLYDGIRISGGTMSIWINTQKKSTQFMYADSVSHMGMTVYSASSNNSLIIPWIGPSPGKKKFSSSRMNWSAWNHIIITFNSACEPVSCYINGGAADQSGTDYWSGTNTAASIGMRANGTSKYTGYIGNIKIFAKEFSSTEMIDLYNKEKVNYQ